METLVLQVIIALVVALAVSWIVSKTHGWKILGVVSILVLMVLYALISTPWALPFAVGAILGLLSGLL